MLVAVGVAAPVAASLRRAWDLSEDRRSSFPPADEARLRAIRAPLTVTVHLAPEDPRLADLQRGVLDPLARVLPHLTVVTAARSTTGLFEGPGQGYGEIWYALGGRRTMSRSTTGPIVLETLYELAGVPAPPSSAGDPSGAYPGYPLAAQPRLAVALCVVGWPLLVALLWWRRRPGRVARLTRRSSSR